MTKLLVHGVQRTPLTALRVRSSGWHRIAVRLCAGLALLAVTACSAMPVKEGPTAKLFSGVERPRDRNDMDITIHEVAVTAWGRCLEIVGRTHPMMAFFSVVTLSPMHGCALLPRDDELEPGERPWCIVGVPKGDADTLEHELRHCEGWNHPRSFQSASKHAARD